MPWIGGAIIGGLGLLGSMNSANASQSAADTQAQAANQASANQLQMFNTINQQQAPYRQAGYTALGDLMAGFGQSPQAYDTNGNPVGNGSLSGVVGNGVDGLPGAVVNATAGGALNRIGSMVSGLYSGENANSGGMPAGYFSHQFNANDLNANLAPNYAFMLSQGQGALQNANNASGGVIGGNALQGLENYTQNYAQNAYQQAYNNYTNNQSNIFNRLASIAGIGQTANQATANAGTAATQAASNYATSAAAAQAAGTIGSANAISGGLSSLGSIYALNNLSGGGLFGGGGSSGSSGGGYFGGITLPSS